MIDVRNKATCSGCHACANVCPKSAIAMKPDEEGFLYPSVDASKCVRCGLCRKVCRHSPLKHTVRSEAYACYSANETIRMQSSSGGMFTVFACEILKRGGVVFGAAFDENLAVKHICVTDEQELFRLRGSKYVQSCIGDTYAAAKTMLQKGQIVFFTGTPCQISGLKRYLGKDYDMLYTADMICHGVPSPKVWQTYLGYMEKQYHNKVNKQTPPSFRDKSQGWLGYSMKMFFENQTEYCMSFGRDVYMGAFVNDLTLRPSCYRCGFKSLSRNSDITLADFWGVSEVMPSLFDNKGTSLVMLNTPKGNGLFESIKANNIVYQKAPLNEALKHNTAAYIGAIQPFARETFVKNVNDDNFDVLYQACLKKGVVEKLWRKGRRILKKIKVMLVTKM